MKTFILKTTFFSLVMAVSMTSMAAKPLLIEQQGSFAVGGAVKTSAGTYNALPHVIKDKDSNAFMDVYNASLKEGGQTLHGDHATVFYQVPSHARALPMVFLHGAGQSMRTWQTTPDGREGFQNIFLRRDFPVYLVDQPRRGQSGRAMVDGTVPATPDDQFWFAQFRIGTYPKFNKGVAFPQDAESLNQFFRQMTPNTASFDNKVISDSLDALFNRIGNGILVTHSQGGAVGWQTAIKNSKVKAIVAYEPGNFPFPEGEVLPVMTSKFGDLTPEKVSPSEFAKLTKLPIVMYFGDFIGDKPSDNQGYDQWRVRYALAKQWAKTVNRHGGDVTLVHLPDVGIKGNTHFAFADLNNVAVADELSKWLKQKHLDDYK